MNPKKSQPKEEIVVHMSAKGLSQEKFSALVNQISLFLSQNIETEPSDGITRYNITKKSFSEEGFEISSIFPYSLPSSLANGFGVSNPASLHSPPVASTLGQRKLPTSTPTPKKLLKTETMRPDSEKKSNKMSEAETVPVLIDLESPTYTTTDFDGSSGGEIRAPFNSDHSNPDFIEEIKPELYENLSLTELLQRDRVKKEKQVLEEKKQVKKEKERAYKEDEAMKVFNPAQYTLIQQQKVSSDKSLSQSQSDSFSFLHEIVISDHEWVFEESCFSPIQEQSQELKGFRSSPELNGLKKKQNLVKKENKTEITVRAHNSTNENSANSLDEEDDCRIECTDPKQDKYLDGFLRKPKMILKPVEKLSRQFDQPQRGSIIIE